MIRFLAAMILVAGLLNSNAVAAEQESPAKKECTTIAANKGLGLDARNRFIGECIIARENAKQTVHIEGKGADKVSEKDKQKLLACGTAAASRHLSGESLSRHMRECLSRP